MIHIRFRMTYILIFKHGSRTQEIRLLSLRQLFLIQDYFEKKSLFKTAILKKNKKKPIFLGFCLLNCQDSKHHSVQWRYYCLYCVMNRSNADAWRILISTVSLHFKCTYFVCMWLCEAESMKLRGQLVMAYHVCGNTQSQVVRLGCTHLFLLISLAHSILSALWTCPEIVALNLY